MLLKLTIFNALYQEGDVNLVVETNVEGVNVPEHLGGKLTNFVVGQSPSPLLEANEEGISAPLRFGGERFVCTFPWPSIRAMATNEAIVNFPVEKESDSDQPPAKKKASPLKVVK
jgi:hypothetical protein